MTQPIEGHGTVRVRIAHDCEIYPVTVVRQAEWGDEFVVVPAAMLAAVRDAEAALDAARNAVVAYAKQHPEACADPWAEPDGLDRYWSGWSEAVRRGDA